MLSLANKPSYTDTGSDEKLPLYTPSFRVTSKDGSNLISEQNDHKWYLAICLIGAAANLIIAVCELRKYFIFKQMPESVTTTFGVVHAVCGILYLMKAYYHCSTISLLARFVVCTPSRLFSSHFTNFFISIFRRLRMQYPTNEPSCTDTKSTLKL